MGSVEQRSLPGAKGPYFGAASNPCLTLWAQLSLSASGPTVPLQLPLSTLDEVEKKEEVFSSHSYALEDVLCPCTAFPSPSAIPSPGLLLVATIRG